MPRIKVRTSPEFREIVYTQEHWNLLKSLRIQAKALMEVFARHGIDVWLHGSVARGDVWKKSDIDVVIPRKITGVIVEYLLEKAGFKPYARYLVAATPTSTIKAYIVLDEEERVSVSFPLSDFKPLELEFYKFGGYITYEELLRDKRVPGVNKSLVLIVPTEQGHLEAPVIGYEDFVAKFLNVSVDVVKERVDVLMRRDRIGRTGIFAKLTLAPSESFEEALERLFKEKPLLRRIHSSSL